MTPDERQHLDEHGYVVLPSAIDATFLAELRALIARELEGWAGPQ